MRIKKLHLQNFRGFENLEMTFPETSNVVVLIGKNGSGKTRILDAIAADYKLHLEKLYSIMPHSEDYEYNKESNDFFAISKSSKVVIEYDTEVIRERFDDDKPYKYKNLREYISIYGLEQASKIPLFAYFSPRKGIRIFAPNLDVLGEYRVDFNPELLYLEPYKYGDSDDLPRVVYEGGEEKIDIVNNQLSILENYNGFYDDCFGIDIKKIESFKEWFLNLENKELQGIFDKKDFNYKLPELEFFRQKLLTFYNHFTTQKFEHIKGNRNGNVFKSENSDITINKGDLALSIENISMGERIPIALVSDICKRLLLLSEKNIGNIEQQSGIVLIDEIDQHLHPEWQRNILPALTKTFPNVQFIVTTHSPQVVSSLPKESVFILKDGKAYNNEMHTRGRDSNSLLQEAFDIPKHEKALADKLNAFYGFLDTKNKESAQNILDELTELWGDNDTEIVRANLYFQDLLDEIANEVY